MELGWDMGDQYVDLIINPLHQGKVVFRKIVKNVWRPKQTNVRGEPMIMNSKLETRKVVSTLISGVEWSKSVIFLKSRALFLKWGV